MKEYNNIFYFANINSIGGVETYFYYLSKKYSDIADITVFYRTGDISQLNRLRKIVRVKRFNNQRIKCKKLFINYTHDIIDYVDAEEYIEIIHGDLKALNKSPRLNPKITKYIGVSQKVCDSFKELTGKDIELCYNPVAIDTPRKVLRLISATRLTKEKGKDRMIRLGEILNNVGIPYVWDIFTNDTLEINNPNIFYRKPVLNIVDYIATADYLVQLSDNEGFGFSPIEALMLGVPVILTKCPVYEELKIQDRIHGFLLDFDMTNIPIEEIYKGLPSFKYKPPKDNWDKLLFKSKSNYKEECNTIEELEVIKDFSFGRFNQLISVLRANKSKDIPGQLFVGDIIKCDKMIADCLTGDNERNKIVAKKIKEEQICKN